jgi:hypothetical protein
VAVSGVILCLIQAALHRRAFARGHSLITLGELQLVHHGGWLFKGEDWNSVQPHWRPARISI